MRKFISLCSATLFLCGCNHSDPHRVGLDHKYESPRLAAVEESPAPFDGPPAVVPAHVESTLPAINQHLFGEQPFPEELRGRIVTQKLQVAIARATHEGGALSVVFTQHQWPDWIDLSFPVDGVAVRAIDAEGQVIAAPELAKRLAEKTFVGLVVCHEGVPLSNLSHLLEKLPGDGILFYVSDRLWKNAEDTRRFMREHSSELSDAADSR